MLVFDQISQLQDFLKAQRSNGKTVAFVPTMGALHEGHLSLIDQANQMADISVCSIYVNPTQFNDPKDLEKYPRVMDQDKELLIQRGCQVLFCPSDREMYPKKPAVQFNFGNLETVMEGSFRPGHFSGVGLVVSKLLHIVSPDIAIFGQKDLQQFLIIQQLQRDLFFNVNLFCAPIVREEDGLAMSSRNRRISAEKRPLASAFYKALLLAQEALLAGKAVSDTKKLVQEFFKKANAVELEYFEISDSQNLNSVTDIQKHSQVSLCIAGYLDGVRLIDNIFLY